MDNMLNYYKRLLKKTSAEKEVKVIIRYNGLIVVSLVNPYCACEIYGGDVSITNVSFKTLSQLL